MTPPSSPRESPLWLAAGAAVTGVLIGGAAVWFGLHDPATDRAATQWAEVGTAATMVSLGAEDVSGAHAGALADAVERTRDTVVTLQAGRTLGAGVIVDPRGIVLTNYHVIAGALAERGPVGFEPRATGTPGPAPVVEARFVSDRKLAAEIVLTDAEEDLAVLRLIPADTQERFAAASVGHSDTLRVGQEVFAVGNPFGLTHTVTRGIVSAVARTGVVANPQVPMLQLDASINLGNSGGPLFDVDGDLVGIVTARRPEAQGIAFALPIDHVQGFLRAATDPQAGRSGMVGAEIDVQAPLPAIARGKGYDAGLVVERVDPGSPAHLAGLRPGDVVVALRGKRLDGLPARDALALAHHLQATVRSMFEGETLAVTAVRDAAVVELAVEVGTATARDQAFIDAEELLGFILDPDASEPVVLGISPQSPLRHLGPKLVGSRIVGLMGQPLAGLDGLGRRLDDLRRQARHHGSAPLLLVTLEDRRGRAGSLLVPVRTESSPWPW